MPIISKKFTIKKAISVHHIGDQEVRGVKENVKYMSTTSTVFGEYTT